MYSRHLDYLKDHYKQLYGLDLEKHMKDKSTLLLFDDAVTSLVFGYGSIDDYYFKASCYHNLPNIRIPTLLIMSKDDPIIGE